MTRARRTADVVNQVRDAAQFCTAVFNGTTTYTVTPVSTQFRTETMGGAVYEGLVIEFELPAGALTGTGMIDYNGDLAQIDWVDGSATAADDIDSTYNKYIRLVRKGTRWLIVSDVSGQNADGNWHRSPDGSQTCDFIQSLAAENINNPSGSLFTGLSKTGPNYAKPFAAIPSTTTHALTTSLSSGVFTTTAGSQNASTTKYSDYILTCIFTRTGVNLEMHFTAQGRWY